MFLNQVEQALFGSEVVIQAGEGHAGGARKVAHGGTFVSFFAENVGGMAEDFAQAAIETGFGRGLLIGRDGREGRERLTVGTGDWFERSF